MGLWKGKLQKPCHSWERKGYEGTFRHHRGTGIRKRRPAIAKLVAQKLNVPFYDKELLTLAAQKSGICQEIFEHNDEKTTVSDMLPVTAGTGFGAGVGLGCRCP